MISVFDYGAGNLRSVQNTLGAIGAEYTLVRDAAALEKAAKVILPGVGHFGQMMRSLDQMNVRSAFHNIFERQIPFLGICLGMHALFGASEEAPEEAGFGLLPGEVRRFPADMRVPHMGWNDLNRKPASRLLQGLGENPYVYFAHSYFCPVVEATAATCTYGFPYTAVIETGAVYGVQFHPEKSGPLGLQIVKNFVNL